VPALSRNSLVLDNLSGACTCTPPIIENRCLLFDLCDYDLHSALPQAVVRRSLVTVLVSISSVRLAAEACRSFVIPSGSATAPTRKRAVATGCLWLPPPRTLSVAVAVSCRLLQMNTSPESLTRGDASVAASSCSIRGDSVCRSSSVTAASAPPATSQNTLYCCVQVCVHIPHPICIYIDLSASSSSASALCRCATDCCMHASGLMGYCAVDAAADGIRGVFTAAWQSTHEAINKSLCIVALGEDGEHRGSLHLTSLLDRRPSKCCCDDVLRLSCEPVSTIYLLIPM
jgi:hypothetical protein